MIGEVDLKRLPLNRGNDLVADEVNDLSILIGFDEIMRKKGSSCSRRHLHSYLVHSKCTPLVRRTHPKVSNT